VGVHAGERELDRGDISAAPSLEQGLPGVVSKVVRQLGVTVSGGREGVEIRVGEEDIQTFKERGSDLRRHQLLLKSLGDLAIEPMEPPDTVVGVELLLEGA